LFSRGGGSAPGLTGVDWRVAQHIVTTPSDTRCGVGKAARLPDPPTLTWSSTNTDDIPAATPSLPVLTARHVGDRMLDAVRSLFDFISSLVQSRPFQPRLSGKAAARLALGRPSRWPIAMVHFVLSLCEDGPRQMVIAQSSRRPCTTPEHRDSRMMQRLESMDPDTARQVATIAALATIGGAAMAVVGGVVVALINQSGARRGSRGNTSRAAHTGDGRGAARAPPETGR
jgi:hypothetical protein